MDDYNKTGYLNDEPTVPLKNQGGNYAPDNSANNGFRQNYYGYRPPQHQFSQQQMPPQQNDSLKVVLITVVAVLLVICLVMVALFAIKKGNEKSDNHNNNDITVLQQQNVDEPTVAPTTPPTQQTYPSPVIWKAQTDRGDVLGSSDLSSSRSFGADQVIDGRPETCWCVNTNNAGGVGGTLTIYLQEKSLVNGISIVNGNIYRPDEGCYRLNGQVQGFDLIFSDGTVVSNVADYNYYQATYQRFNLTSPVVTDKITLRVTTSYVGDKFTTNVCIGEITVF